MRDAPVAIGGGSFGGSSGVFSIKYLLIRCLSIRGESIMVNRESMRPQTVPNLRGLLILGVIGCCFATGKHALADNLPPATMQESDWSGFDPAFHPTWTGNQKVITWTPPPQTRYDGVSVSGCVIMMANFNHFIFAQPKPIELLSSSRTTTSHATTGVTTGSQSVLVDTPGGDTFSSSGNWNSQYADYARVFNQKGIIMGESRSIGDLDSNISDDHLNATGRVQATTTLEHSLLPASSTTATGGSSLAASYQLNVPCSFTLDGTLSGGGDVDLKFSLINDNTGKAIYNLIPRIDPQAGHSWSFDLSGQLDPGRYSIKISAATDAGVSAGGADLGGAGQYNLDFSAKPLQDIATPHGLVIPAAVSASDAASGTLEATQSYLSNLLNMTPLGGTGQIQGYFSPPSFGAFAATTGSIDNGNLSIPEPSSLLLMMFLPVAAAYAKRRWQ
jgi:hypothetical protein